MKAVHIGIIAEDESDVEVVKILIGKLTGKRFSVSRFIGKGCGPLKRKTPAWCKAFQRKGCQSVLLVHDKDRSDAMKLRAELENLLAGASLEVRVVVIPTEEIEAWLLADCDAIEKAMSLVKRPKEIAHPESVVSPKEHLARVVRVGSRNGMKQYVNSVHNQLIASNLRVSQLRQRCPSFQHLQAFVKSAIGV